MRGIIFTLILLFSVPAFGDILEAMNSVCRIHTGKTVGSGWVYAEDKDYYWIITAGHVVKDNEKVVVTFYINGIEDSYWAEIQNVDWVNLYERTLSSYRDLATIRLDKKAFGKNAKPSVIPWAKDDLLKSNTMIFSSGCPSGQWASGFFGRIRSVNELYFIFSPISLPGRSGSPVFNSDGTKVIGVVVWYNPRSNFTAAICKKGMEKHQIYGWERPRIKVKETTKQ